MELVSFFILWDGELEWGKEWERERVREGRKGRGGGKGKGGGESEGGKGYMKCVVTSSKASSALSSLVVMFPYVVVFCMYDIIYVG